MKRHGFTLIELLVVIAIIAILAAILFPVFAAAKAQAKKAACIAQANQWGKAAAQYMPDYDDYHPLLQYSNSYDANPVDPDACLGNIMQPYMKNYQILSSPGDKAGNAERDRESPYPSNTRPQYRQAQLNFNLALKADYGYNTQYFAPMGNNCTEFTDRRRTFFNVGTSASLVGGPSSTLMFINSIWDRSASGVPFGGGNWGLDMPCRTYADGTDSLPPRGSCTNLWWWGGWRPNTPNAWNVFGGAWPWHMSSGATPSGVAVVVFADSSTKAFQISRLTRGCDVRIGWTGRIFDASEYIWDLRE